MNLNSPISKPLEFERFNYGEFATIKGVEFDPFEREMKQKINKSNLNPSNSME